MGEEAVGDECVYVESSADVRKWINEWNADPKPFVWTTTADEILDTLAAYYCRINDSRN